MTISLKQQPHVVTATAIQSGAIIFNPQHKIKLTYTAHAVFPMPLSCSLSAHIGREQFLLVL